MTPKIMVKRERSLRDEINRLVSQTAATINTAGLTGIDMDETLTAIRAAAEQSVECEPIKHLIAQKIHDAQQWIALLGTMLDEVQVLEARRRRQDGFGYEWWQQHTALIHSAFAQDARRGTRAWLDAYARALAAGEIALCERLVGELSPRADADLIETFRAGTTALVEDKFPDALDMLDHLIRELSVQTTAPVADERDEKSGERTTENAEGAGGAEAANESSDYDARTADYIVPLKIFEGRVYLERVGAPKQALKRFEGARDLAPRTGQPYAALANYYQAQGQPERAEELADTAIKLSPDAPDGYVALGAWAESQGRREEAAEFYARAVEKVWNEKDPYAALSRLLAPMPAELCFALARRLLREGYPEDALMIVEQSATLKRLEDEASAKATAYELQGDAFAALGRPKEEVAEHYFKAGQHCYWYNEPQLSRRLLTRANEINPDHLPTYWYLLDATRSINIPQGDSPPDEKLIAECFDVWEKGARISLPDADHSWVYISLALLCEQQAQLPPQFEQLSTSWKALVYLERAIVRESQEVLRWAMLARFYRYLSLEANARYATGKALGLNANDVTAMVEQATTMLNAGELEECKELAWKLRDTDQKVWAEIVNAYFLLVKGQYEEATELLNAILESAPDEFTSHELRALCHQLRGDHTRAREDYEALIAISEKQPYQYSHPDFRLTVGWAKYMLGETEQAEQIYRPLIGNPLKAGAALRGLGLCRLARSNGKDGEDELRELKAGLRDLSRGIARAVNVRELDELSKFNLDDLAHSAAAWTADTRKRETLARLGRRIGRRRRQFVPPPSAGEQLDQLSLEMSRSPVADEADITAKVAVAAGRARLHVAKEEWVAAGSIYREMRSLSALFPEADVGLELCVEKLRAEGERSSGKFDYAGSVGFFEQALEFEQHLTRPAESAVLRQRLGDLYLKQNRYREALALYEKLAALPLRFASSLALRKAPRLLKNVPAPLQALLQNSPAVLRLVENLADKAPKWFDRLTGAGDEAKDGDAANLRRLADLHSRLGYTRFNLGDTDDAQAHFALALQLYRLTDSPDGSDPGAMLGTACRALPADATRFWALDAAWEALQRDTRVPEDFRHDLGRARTALAGCLSDLYGFADDTPPGGRSLPYSAPITIELGDALTPEDTTLGSPLFMTYIPEMRGRVKQEMGVEVPGVLARDAAALPPDGYWILLADVPLATGSIPPGTCFCFKTESQLRESGLADDALTEAVHPLTGETGCWVRRERVPPAADYPAPRCDDHLLFIVNHLEAVLRRNAADYMGVQEVENLIQTWKMEQKDADLTLAEIVSADLTAKLRFGRVLRLLLAESVPVTDLREILEAAVESDSRDDVFKAVRDVRLRLRRRLPGNSLRAARRELPAEIEDPLDQWLKHDNGKTFFAISPEATRNFLNAVRALVNPANDHEVLVVRSADLRPFIRRMVEVEFPSLMVIACDELIAADGAADAGDALPPMSGTT